MVALASIPTVRAFTLKPGSPQTFTRSWHAVTAEESEDPHCLPFHVARRPRRWDLSFTGATELELDVLEEHYIQTNYGILPMSWETPEIGEEIAVVFAEPKVVGTIISGLLSDFVVSLQGWRG